MHATRTGNNMCEANPSQGGDWIIWKSKDYTRKKHLVFISRCPQSTVIIWGSHPLGTCYVSNECRRFAPPYTAWDYCSQLLCISFEVPQMTYVLSLFFFCRTFFTTSARKMMPSVVGAVIFLFCSYWDYAKISWGRYNKPGREDFGMGHRKTQNFFFLRKQHIQELCVLNFPGVSVVFSCFSCASWLIQRE